jgi:hypothetical protein
MYEADETTSGGISPFTNPEPARTARPPTASPALVTTRMSGSVAYDAPPVPILDPREAQIAREKQAFRPVSVLFNQPTLLPYNQQTLIRFVIASADIEEAKGDFGDTTGAVTTTQAKVGRQVRAQLSGPPDAVEIKLVGTDTRDISGAANTTFEWYVTPKTTGTFKLTLRLLNKVYDGKDTIELEQPAVVKEFQVSVSATQRLQLLLSEINGWLALLGSSLVALLGLFLTKLRARFAAKKPDEGPPAA